jgi:hypothetical protein
VQVYRHASNHLDPGAETGPGRSCHLQDVGPLGATPREQVEGEQGPESLSCRTCCGQSWARKCAV